MGVDNVLNKFNQQLFIYKIKNYLKEITSFNDHILKDEFAVIIVDSNNETVRGTGYKWFQFD